MLAPMVERFACADAIGGLKLLCVCQETTVFAVLACVPAFGHNAKSAA